MSSTNKTEHYNLPQFIGSDIPTWLGDFNSAMAAIDSGINAAATSASGAATTAAQALETANRCPFPVGYGGFFQTDPNTIYSGTTWEQKKDVFILASGDSYAVGSTGGEAQHTLTENEMPRHMHQERCGDQSTSQNISAVKRRAANGGEEGVILEGKWASTGLDGNVTTGLSGGSQPHNNMPPYFAMPFWIRTA